MKTIVKIEAGKPVIFFPEEPANPARVLCFHPVGGHSEAARAYMRALPTPLGREQRNAAWQALASYARTYGAKQ